MSDKRQANRSAVTGRFVNEDEAKANPESTVKETIRNPGREIRAWAVKSGEGIIHPDFITATREDALSIVQAGESIVPVAIRELEEE